MSWQRIRGHDGVRAAFENVWRQGRLAHAYLFLGPAGVGKKLFATELAKALLCEQQSAGVLAACDRCTSCHLLDAGTHPDFFQVGKPAESNELPIEVMRALCGSFTLKAARGRGKVAVLDDADTLNDASANCFLKTLEEPPPLSVFILIGVSKERQMPTIRSRCQQVRFAPLPPPLLQELLQAQGITEPRLLERLVRLSDGSPGVALDLSAPELWDFREEFLTQLARPRFDPGALGKQWLTFVEEAGKESAAQRRRAAAVLQLLIAFLDDVLRLGQGANTRAAEAAELERLRAFAGGRAPERVLELLERCLQAETQLQRYIQIALVLEGLLDAFCEPASARRPG